MLTSPPEPSSAMVGSCTSQLSAPLRSQSSSSQRHTQFTMTAAAAPARCALRTLLTKWQSPRRNIKMNADPSASPSGGPSHRSLSTHFTRDVMECP
eukprot:scaffold407_cov251-Pinguiococcus_pyrenoidosus.AAC.34